MQLGFLGQHLMRILSNLEDGSRNPPADTPLWEGTPVQEPHVGSSCVSLSRRDIMAASPSKKHRDRSDLSGRLICSHLRSGKLALRVERGLNLQNAHLQHPQAHTAAAEPQLCFAVSFWL